MPYLLKIKKTIEAAHSVYDSPDKKEDIHGHSWNVILTWQTTTQNDENEKIKLETNIDTLLEEFDHCNLDTLDRLGSSIKTTEFIANQLFKTLAKIQTSYKLLSVNIEEEKDSFSSYIRSKEK